MRTIATIVAAVAGTVAAVQATQHPTLPTNWKATVNEAQVGVVYESYRMVDKPTATNPSGKWTNFTDGSCQRLIYDGPDYAAMRYLLSCDSLPCCTEEQSGNHMEYQIPNVHPAIFAPVTYGGKETINLPDGDIDADVWKWSFGLGKYFAFTTGGDVSKNETAQLHRWVVQAQGQNFTNDYYNYTTVEEDQAWIDSFTVPDICSNADSCDNAHKKGLLSDKSLAFVKQQL